jgi:hypothetical protein
VAEYRIDALKVWYQSHLSQPIVQVIALKPIYSQLQSESISKFVPFALLLNPNIQNWAVNFLASIRWFFCIGDNDLCEDTSAAVLGPRRPIRLRRQDLTSSWRLRS